MIAMPSFTPAAQLEIVREFLCEVSRPDQPKTVRCHNFTLFHNSEHGAQPLWTKYLCDKNEGLDRIGEERRAAACAEIAAAFMKRAEGATTLGPHRQSFVLAAYAVTTVTVETRPVHQQPFALEPPPEIATGFSASEEPSEKMALGTLMKWCEATMRMMHEGMRDARKDMQETASRNERLLSLSTDRTTFLEDAMLKMTVALQESLDKRAERDVNAYGRKLEIEREERMYRAVETMVAKYVDAKLGVGPLSGFIRENKEIVGAMFKSLSPEKKSQFAELIALHAPELVAEDVPAQLANGAAEIK